MTSNDQCFTTMYAEIWEKKAAEILTVRFPFVCLYNSFVSIKFVLRCVNMKNKKN